MSRHVFCITTHEMTPTFPRLVERLAPHGEVLCHVDGHVALSPFVEQLPQVTFVEDRVRVFYPDWSLTEAEIILVRRALEVDGVERITLLRSTHYPLVTADRLAALADDPADHIAAFPAPDASRGKPVTRFTYRATRTRHFDSRRHALYASIRGRLIRPLDWTEALGEIQLRAGSSYWSLTADTVRGVLARFDEGGELRTYFQSISQATECLFHTLAPTVSSNISCHAISYSNWGGHQSPEPLTVDTLRGAMEDGTYLFAKKFTPELADWVDQQLEITPRPTGRAEMGLR